MLLIFFLAHHLSIHSTDGTLKVLSYSAFLNSWGPGPEIAQKFYESSGIKIEFIDAGEAGLLNEKLKIFKVDVVLGLDQMGRLQAGDSQKWLDLKRPLTKYSDHFFQAIDWAPMTFIYRKSDGPPPRNLDELLNPKYKFSVPDPRTSTPGLQFLFWIVKVKGFEYLKALKKNIGFVGASWSASYGSFQKKQSALTFSYLTSPVYHWSEEKNFDYQPVVLEEPVPIQVEFVAIPELAEHAENARKFVNFLLQEDTQKILMQKNFMLPIHSALTTGFSELPEVKTLDVDALNEFFKDRESILNRWQEIWN